MYGATRKRVPNLPQIVGISAAAAATAAAAYALANGFLPDLASAVEARTTFTPAIEDKTQPEPAKDQDLPTADNMKLVSPEAIPPTATWEVRKDVIIGTTDPVDRDEPRTGTETRAAVAPAPLRSAPKMISDNLPTYPAVEVRKGNQGISTLEVCLNAGGRVTSATIAISSGHPGLDAAALKWVRTARFTPGKLDGVPQAVCGHNVVYEWNLRSVRG